LSSLVLRYLSYNRGGRGRAWGAETAHTAAGTRVRPIFLMGDKDPGLDRSFDADRVDRMCTLSRIHGFFRNVNIAGLMAHNRALVLPVGGQSRFGGSILNCQPGSPAAARKSP